MPLDMHHVRRQFPALADGFGYLDNAGGSLVLERVADRVRDYLLTTSVQTGASYPQSRRAVERLGEARRSVARLVNAKRPEEIVLGPCTTVMFQFLARAMAGRLRPGDEVVVTDFDHESNIGPWRALEERGVVIRTWELDENTFEVSLDELDRLMTERTRLVAVTHCSNILGTVNPVAEMTSSTSNSRSTSPSLSRVRTSNLAPRRSMLSIEASRMKTPPPSTLSSKGWT